MRLVPSRHQDAILMQVEDWGKMERLMFLGVFYNLVMPHVEDSSICGLATLKRSMEAI